MLFNANMFIITRCDERISVDNCPDLNKKGKPQKSRISCL